MDWMECAGSYEVVWGGVVSAGMDGDRGLELGQDGLRWGRRGICARCLLLAVGRLLVRVWIFEAGQGRLPTTTSACSMVPHM